MENYIELREIYRQTLNTKNEWVFKIQSTILMVSSATFAILVSLSSPLEGNMGISCKVLLSLAIVSNALCILFASISVFENRVMSNEFVYIAQEHIKRYNQGSLTVDYVLSSSSVPRKKNFVICEKCSYISFLLFIIVLTIYAIYRIFST